MPRFLVERDFEQLSDEQYQEAVERSKMLNAKFAPDVVWMSTHVCSNEGGTTKAYCVYEGPSAKHVEEHVERVGIGELVHVLEIVGTMTPEGATA